MTASPLTGGGPHKGAPEEKPQQQVQKGPPKAPPTAPPKQPRQTQPGGHKEAVGVPPQQQQQPAPVYPQQTAFAATPQMPMVGMPSGVMDPAMASLLTQTLDQNRTQAQKFLLLELPEDDWPRLHEFETVQEIIDAIKARLGTNCHLFPFLGQKLGITEGPNRFLITPYGPLPLFDIPEPTEAGEAEYGWVGDSLDRPEPPGENDEEEDDELDAPEESAEEDGEQPEPEDEDETPMFEEG